jgi:hypothetical protein
MSFFPFALAPFIDDDPAWRGWPFPINAQGEDQDIGQYCQDASKSTNRFLTAANLRPVGPRQLPQSMQLSAQRSLEERRL